MHNLGALSLDATPLKHSLRAEAANWKAHFSKNIHSKAGADLQVGLQWPLPWLPPLLLLRFVRLEGRAL